MKPILLLAAVSLISCLLDAAPAQARSAEIVCDPANVRTPTTVSLATPVNGEFWPISGGQLAWIDVLWLADEQTDRLREYVTVDWRNDSLSAVQVYDVALGGKVQDDVAPTRLVASSDFASGRVDFDFCMPWGATHGLAVAYYEIGYREDGRPKLAGAVAAFETRERPRYFAESNRSGRWFDIGFSSESIFTTGQSSERMVAMIEGATGTPPPDYLGGSLVIEATSLRDVEPVRFIAPQDGILSGNTFTVTGPNPSLLASHWVTSVRHGGREQLTADGLLPNLDPDNSPLEVILGEESGAERFLLHVVDGRLDIEHEPFACPGRPGTGAITGVSKGSPLESGLRYFRGLSQGFAAIEDGRFEVTGLNCPPNTDQTLVTVRGTLGDQVRLAIDARPGDGSQAHLCASFNSPSGWECSPIRLVDVRTLFGLSTADLAGGEWLSLRCRASRGGMDSVDAFVDGIDRLSLSSQRNIQEILRGAEGTLMDSDGDGSVCNARELLTRERVLQGIDIWVTPAL